MIRTPVRPLRWGLLIACNDPNTGMETGRIDALQLDCGRGNYVYGTDWLPEYDLHLVATRRSLQAYWLNDAELKLEHLTLPVRGIPPHVGKWCWDGWFVNKETVRKIGHYLRRRGWEADGGSVRLVRWYDSLPT